MGGLDIDPVYSTFCPSVTSTRPTSKLHFNTFQYSVGGAVTLDAITYGQDCTVSQFLSDADIFNHRSCSHRTAGPAVTGVYCNAQLLTEKALTWYRLGPKVHVTGAHRNPGPTDLALQLPRSQFFEFLVLGEVGGGGFKNFVTRSTLTTHMKIFAYNGRDCAGVRLYTKGRNVAQSVLQWNLPMKVSFGPKDFTLTKCSTVLYYSR